MTTEEERFLRNPTREPPESHGYPCPARNRGINLPTVINRKARRGERRAALEIPLNCEHLKAGRLKDLIWPGYRTSVVLPYAAALSAVDVRGFACLT